MKQHPVAMLVALACAFGCLPARSEVLNLEGDYAGTAMFGPIRDFYVE